MNFKKINKKLIGSRYLIKYIRISTWAGTELKKKT